MQRSCKKFRNDERRDWVGIWGKRRKHYHSIKNKGHIEEVGKVGVRWQATRVFCNITPKIVTAVGKPIEPVKKQIDIEKAQIKGLKPFFGED